MFHDALSALSYYPLRSTLSAHHPIDQAKGILAYIQDKHPDKGYDVDDVMSVLVDIQLRPENLSNEITFNVNVISEISGKSYPTLFRTISLLKLPDEFQTAIRSENLPVSQGYLFAANLDCAAHVKAANSVLRHLQDRNNSTLLPKRGSLSVAHLWTQLPSI